MTLLPETLTGLRGHLDWTDEIVDASGGEGVTKVSPLKTLAKCLVCDSMLTVSSDTMGVRLLW